MERESEKLPAPLELTLKEGARVMFTRNDEDHRWVNGTFGIVRRLDADAVVVDVGPDGGGATHPVGPAAWESHRYRYDRATDRIEAEVVGSYKQIPLMPAWAVTIHKCRLTPAASISIFRSIDCSPRPRTISPRDFAPSR